MKDKKKIVIGILCALVCVMAVGYALLAQQLNINGRASIDSTWKVEITNITEKDIVGDATSKETPSYTSTTANFSVGLIQPADSITYDIEISNLGTLKAKVDSIDVIMDTNDAIIYTTSGLKQGDKLEAGEKATLTVKVEYSSTVTSQPTNTGKELTVTINYVQDLGNDVVTYDTYSIGDQITFAGSNWYVIKNSTSEEDYVTLLKEKVLINEELGEYAANRTVICEQWMVESGYGGCKEEGQIVTESYDAMPYYWSDTCHFSGLYEYANEDTSGCSGHNDYEGSKVKEFLERTYINVLGETNLKEVDGYNVRLLHTNDLVSIIGNGFVPEYATRLNNSENAPSWLYVDGDGNDIKEWWLMDQSEEPNGAWYVGYFSDIVYTSLWNQANVRPVINLLKSSI